MGHGEHEGHGAGMVRDFLRRLVVSTILSLPLIIFSPAGAVFGLPSIPPFGVSMGLLGFLLATPIVWWGGWPFISGAWRALRAGEVNMMTLIAVGILVSYFYSVAATFLFPGNVFYDAAAKAFARAMMAAFVAATARQNRALDLAQRFRT
jgi:P-type Cu2+ transporter